MAATPLFSSLQTLPLLILLLLLSAQLLPTSAGQQPSIRCTLPLIRNPTSQAPTPGSAEAPDPSTTAPGILPLPPHGPVPAPAPHVSPPGGSGGDNENAGKIAGKSSSGEMSTGKKVGSAFGVIIGAGVVGLGGYVCKKRQANIRRSRYAYAAVRHQL